MYQYLLYSCAILALSVSGAIASQHVESKRPNVVFILADDQDAKLDSLDYMPSVQKHLINEGTHYQKHYCTVALCCPSRVSLWTGKTAHNTNVTNVVPPYGGYPKFITEGHNQNWVPLWLQNEGVQTYYVGKLMNHQNILNYNKPYPSGFTGSDFLLDPNTYNYMAPIFQRNQAPPILHSSTYSTDLIREKSIAFLDQAAQDSASPFFLTIAPIAPHSDYTVDVNIGGEPPIGIDIQPPVSAERHASLFANASVPRGPSFNPDVPSGVDWIAAMPVLSAEDITYNDHLYRQRLRSLQAVDEIVEAVVQKLEDYGILDNTYIFYSSDNGYHIGQHRLPPGKGCGFEEDINVPRIVRGPGVPSGKKVNFATNHVDLAPTFFEIMSMPLREDFDGVPVPLTEKGICALEESGKAAEHVQIEFWMLKNPSEYNNEGETNNTYKGVRIVGEGYGWYYSVWCSGSHELYDMTKDPSQTNNLLSTNVTSSVRMANTTYPLTALQTRLDAMILVLKTCKGKVCSDPWAEILPGTGVTTLAQGMASAYDQYFAQLPKVSYSACEDGYLLASEGPVWGNASSVDVHSLARRGRPIGNRP